MVIDEAHASLLPPADGMAEIDTGGTLASKHGHHVAGVTRKQIRYQNAPKRAIDLLGSLLLVVVAALPMLVTAIAVRISLGRPVIFRQTRVGRQGALFTVFKFRTMTVDRRVSAVAWNDGDRRKTHKGDDDPRLTPVGQRLRRWSLDELPQLWNVIRGDMSLVGPRPELPSIVDGFAPWQHERHEVKPGLTGFWQVYARGDGTTMQERTDLDIAYVHSVSLRVDLKVLLLTIPAIIGLKRGY
jgi:lipopolysaccharide/colanic/teichoic acid biosynthesis glycosyltransferase